MAGEALVVWSSLHPGTVAFTSISLGAGLLRVSSKSLGWNASISIAPQVLPPRGRGNSVRDICHYSSQVPKWSDAGHDTNPTNSVTPAPICFIYDRSKVAQLVLLLEQNRNMIKEIIK